MGICFSKPTSESKRINDEIERRLQKDREQNMTEVKMLLLGAGESGKSTILKQMKLINEGGYTERELKYFRGIINNNIISSIKTLVTARDRLQIPFSNPQSEQYSQIIRNAPDQVNSEPLDPDIVAAIKNLWAEDAITQVFKRAGSEFHLIDSAKYYLDSIDRISQTSYQPTDQDVLRSRSKTTGIVETKFHVDKLTYRMFDVGGQRSERKKWIHCFENVHAILFLVAVSEYDEKLIEDESVNRMQEALTLFDSICNSRWFVKTSIILFLNKIDIFREKITQIPIDDFFEDYEGGPDFDSAIEYFRERFVSLNQNENKTIYTHNTCATDTTQIRFVMNAVYDIIVKENLRRAGLV
jgi:guanine nucleotide-binding protein G(i) subunit alpha